MAGIWEWGSIMRVEELAVKMNAGGMAVRKREHTARTVFKKCYISTWK